METFSIMQKDRVDDGIGGFTTGTSKLKDVNGYIDLINGTDLAIKQNALVQESTHVAILPFFSQGIGITADMELIDDMGKTYVITYVDDPVNAHHHWELYLTFKSQEVANG